ITPADLLGRTSLKYAAVLAAIIDVCPSLNSDADSDSFTPPANSLPFATVQQRVAQMIHDKILIGCVKKGLPICVPRKFTAFLVIASALPSASWDLPTQIVTYVMSPYLSRSGSPSGALE